MECIYCTDRETLDRHHIACPARPTADEAAAGQLDSAQVDIQGIALWRQGYDHAATGHALADHGPAPEFRLGWSRRVSRGAQPTLRPAMFLSLRALLERLRGQDLRTDSFGIQLAPSLFYLDGDAAEVSATVRYWPTFPHLRDPSDDQGTRLKAEFVLATSKDEAERAYAKVVLNGDPNDEIRMQVRELLRSAEATGRLTWRGDRGVDLNEVDAFLKQRGFAPTQDHWHECDTMARFAAAIEVANGGKLLAAA